MVKCLSNEGPAYLSKYFEMLSSIPNKQKLGLSYSLKVKNVYVEQPPWKTQVFCFYTFF